MESMQGNMLISGNLVDSVSGERIDVINPATEEVVGSVPRGTAEDAE